MSTPDRAALLAAANHAPDFPIPAPLVAPRRRTAAAWGAKRAAELLGSRRVPDIKWFKQSRETGDVLGSAAPGASEIYVRTDLSLADTAGVSGHECGHALGYESEVKCDELRRQVQAEWTEYRRRNRDALAAQIEVMKRRVNLGAPQWLGLPSVKRLEVFYGGNAAGKLDLKRAALALEDWELADDELDVLFADPSGPTRHLQIKSTNPPSPTWSFSRAAHS